MEIIRRLSCLVALLLLASSLAAAGPARWTVNTADTKVTLGVGDDQRLVIHELSGPDGWNWTAAGSPTAMLGRVDVDGAPVTPKWTYRDAAVDSSDGTKLTVIFTNAEPAMELRTVWHAHPGPGPVRHTMSITNKSGKPVTIYQQESLDVHVVGPGDSSVWYIKNDASVPDPTGVYHDPLAGGYRKELKIAEGENFIPFVVVDSGGARGVYIGWEWSIGRIAIAAEQPPRGASLKAGSGDRFKTDLGAGETFEVPPGFLGAYRGDLDDAANSLHKYLFHHSMPALLRNDPSFPKVEWNAFAATGQGQGSWTPTETKYYPLVDDIAPLGFEEIVLDVGWWNGDTTHQPHPPVGHAKLWPGGMLAARDYAHKHGMRFGLYWNCNPSMTTAEGMQHRKDDIKYLFDKFQVDFYRSDSTAGPVLQTGNFGPQCRAHYAEDQGYWQTKGFYEVTDWLWANIPNFAYENCSGGGSIKDYGIMRRAVRIQDQDRYYPIDARRAFYDASYALHPMQIATLSGSWAEWQATGSVYEFRSASLAAPYWHPDAPNGGNGGPKWSASQRMLVKEAVNTYKTKIRPLVRAGNLYHIFPRPDDKIWDGVEYFDPVAKRGVVYVFRPGSPKDSETVKLKGLDPQGRYWLWCEDGSFPPVEKSGSELMAQGFTIRLAEPLSSDLVFLQDAALGKPAEQPPQEFRLKPAQTKGGLFGVSAELSWEPADGARFYRVAVSDSVDFARVLAGQTVAVPSAAVAKLPPSQKLYWRVEAVSRGGVRPNSDVPGTFTTPEGPAKGLAFASDLPWVKATAGAENPVRRDANLKGRPITIDGKPYPKAVWTHSFNDSTPADILFDIADRKYTVFKATVGLDDLGEHGSVQFQVLVDGQKKAESPVMRPKKTHELVVDVAQAKQVTLRVLNGGDGYGWDHAVWGLARFLEAGVTDPLAAGRQDAGQ